MTSRDNAEYHLDLSFTEEGGRGSKYWTSTWYKEVGVGGSCQTKAFLIIQLCQIKTSYDIF